LPRRTVHTSIKQNQQSQVGRQKKAALVGLELQTVGKLAAAVGGNGRLTDAVDAMDFSTSSVSKSEVVGLAIKAKESLAKYAAAAAAAPPPAAAAAAPAATAAAEPEATPAAAAAAAAAGTDA